MKITRQSQIKRLMGVTVSLLSLCAIAHPAAAQLGNQTGIADPSRAGEQMRQNSMMPKVSPDISVKRAPVLGVPAGAEKIKFVLKDVAVDGASVYSQDQIRSIYKDRVGSEITLADVYAIANQLTLKYRNDGYILTQVVVPPQTIGNGVPKLTVVEGYVHNIEIQKADESAPIDMNNVQAYASQISRGGPLNARDLERQLLLINDLPGITARSVLSPAPSTPGAADMTIIVDYDPVDGIVSADNFGSRYLGPLQLGAAATLNSMLGMNEAISGQVAIAPQDWYELAYGALGYEMPVGNLGTKVHVNTSITDTEPGWDLKQFDVQGRSYLVNVGATHPFIRSRAQNLYGRINFDWRRVRSENNVEDTRKDRISELRIGGRYEFVDTFLTAAANTIDMEVSKGLGIFGASDEGDDNMTRDAADPQATKLNLELQRLQRVTNGVNLLLAGRGQLSSNALLSSEEFSVGGIGLGRGYDPSEITGDEGVAAKVELQWNDPVKVTSKFLDSYQLFGFYDVGKVWNDDATTADQEIDSLASVGAGIRLDLAYDVDAGVGVAVPLTRERQTSGDHDPKVYLNISKRF